MDSRSSGAWQTITRGARGLPGGPWSALVVLALVVLMGAASAKSAYAAATITVRCNTNPGALAGALASASDGDTLIVYGRCTGNFEIAHSLTIQGEAAILDGQGTGSVVTVDAGETVAARNLAITRGNDTSSSGPGGGGVRNDGTLTLANSRVTGNMATGTAFLGGGGIANTGTLTLTNSVVSGNSANGPDFAAGGILNTGKLTVTNSALRQNNATADTGDNAAGGIANLFTGSTALINSLVSGNDANATTVFDTVVGGILNLGPSTLAPSTITLMNSKVNENTASGTPSDAFGGILNSSPGAIATLTNSTVSANIASAPGGTGAFSIAVGGINNAGGTLTLTNSSVRLNTANEPNGGFFPPVGGIANYFGATATLSTSIVANNIPNNCNFSDPACAP
jgi:hypothetical protein